MPDIGRDMLWWLPDADKWLRPHAEVVASNFTLDLVRLASAATEKTRQAQLGGQLASSEFLRELRHVLPAMVAAGEAARNGGGGTTRWYTIAGVIALGAGAGYLADVVLERARTAGEEKAPQKDVKFGDVDTATLLLDAFGIAGIETADRAHPTRDPEVLAVLVRQQREAAEEAAGTAREEEPRGAEEAEATADAPPSEPEELAAEKPDNGWLFW